MTASDGIIWHRGAMTGICVPPNRAVLETSDGRLVQKGHRSEEAHTEQAADNNCHLNMGRW